MALRGVASQSNTTAGTTCAVTVSGIGIQLGDVILFVANGGGGGTNTFTYPSGFAAVPGCSNMSIASGNNTLGIAYKVATSTEVSATTLTYTSSANDYQSGHVRVYSGRNSSSPFTATQPTGPVAAATSPISVSETGLTGVAGDDLVNIIGLNNIGGSPAITFGGFSGFANEGYVVPGANFSPYITYMDEVNYGGGLTGTVTGTLTAGSASIAYGAYLISIAAGSAPITHPNQMFFAKSLSMPKPKHVLAAAALGAAGWIIDRRNRASGTGPNAAYATIIATYKVASAPAGPPPRSHSSSSVTTETRYLPRRVSMLTTRRQLLSLSASAAVAAALRPRFAHAAFGPYARGAGAVVGAAGRWVGGNYAAGGNGQFYYEQLRAFKNLVRESRGITSTTWAPVPYTSAGWPDGTVGTLNCLLYDGAVSPPWASGTMKGGFIGTGSETIAGLYDGAVANIVHGTGGAYTTFDLTTTGGLFGFQLSGVTAPITNVFVYPAAYAAEMGTAIDDPTNVDSVTTEAVAFWAQFRHLRWMWPSFMPFNNLQGTAATAKTAANFQFLNTSTSTTIPWSTAPAAGATSGILASNFTGPTGVYTLIQNLTNSSTVALIATCTHGSPNITWVAPLAAGVSSASIGFGFECYPPDWGVTIAQAANIDLWLCSPLFEDGANYSAGGWSTRMLQMLASRAFTNEVVLEFGNENWNPSYNGSNTLIALVSQFGFATVQQYTAYRLRQMRVLANAHFPSAKIVYADQAVVPSRMGATLSDYGAYGTVATDIGYLAFAPYANPALSDTDTIAQIQSAAQTEANNIGVSTASSGYQAENNAITAWHYGIPFVCYEGPSFQWNDSPYSGVTNLGAAILDPGMVAPLRTLYSNIINSGVAWGTHFEIGCSAGATGSNNAPVDEPTNSLPDLYAGNAPTLTAIFSVSPPGSVARTRNVITTAGTVIDGRNWADNYAAYSGVYPTLGESLTSAPNFVHGQIPYHVYSAVARTVSLSANFTNSGSAGSTQLEYGSVQNGGYAILGGGSPTTATIPTGTNTVSIGSYPVPAGDSYIVLGVPGTSQAAITINSVTFG